MHKLIKRLVCLIRGHKWKTPICSRCGKNIYADLIKQ